METNRLEYRTPREPRAVRVYTIAQESRHVIVENIPSLGLVNDLVTKFSSFGDIAYHSMLDDHPSSTETTDVFYVIYNEISSARKAKRLMDDKVFFTNRLRIYYTPEYESPQDIRDKFNERFQTIRKKCHKSKASKKQTKNHHYDFSPKQNTTPLPLSSTSPSIKEEIKDTRKRRRI